MATEVAPRESQVPDLVRTPALSITAEDVALPRLYLGQFMSAAVQEGRVKAGSIFAATGQDDADPQVLWTLEDKKNPGVLFHVIGMRKAKSFSEGGELQLFDYDDPNAPPEAWVTYNYSVVVPEVDTDVPFKLLLTRTGRPTALKINTVLKKNSISGPAWNNAFRLTAIQRENAKGKFFIAKVAQVEADPEHIKVAEELAVMMSSSEPERRPAGDQPAI